MPTATILPVKQRTPEWLEARYDGIGASEAAAAVGLSHWQSRIGLWAHKLRLVPSPEPTMAMRLGVELEPFIARQYTDQTGVKVRRANNLRQHPEHAWMLASIDRRAGRKPIELKFSSRGDGYGEPGTDDVPDEVLLQVLHQLAVLDEPEGEVALLRPGRDEVDVYVIRRQQEAEAALIAEEAVLWDHVQTRTEPPVDGSDATKATLGALYRGRDDVVLEADEALATALVDLHDTRQTIDRLEAFRATREAEIKAAMLAAEASLVRAEGIGEIPWRSTKPRETTDWKRLAGAFRDVLEALPDLDGSVERALSDGFGTTRLDEIVGLHTETKETAPRFGPPKWTEEE